MEDIFSFIVCVCARSLYSAFPIIFAHQKAVCILFSFSYVHLSIQSYVHQIQYPCIIWLQAQNPVSAEPMASNSLQADVYDRKSDKPQCLMENTQKNVALPSTLCQVSLISTIGSSGIMYPLSCPQNLKIWVYLDYQTINYLFLTN